MVRHPLRDGRPPLHRLDHEPVSHLVRSLLEHHQGRRLSEVENAGASRRHDHGSLDYVRPHLHTAAPRLEGEDARGTAAQVRGK